MQLDDQGTHYTARFGSWEECVSFVEHAPSEVTPDQQASRLNSRERVDFCGGLTYKQTIRTANDGWEAGADLVNRHALKSFRAIADRIERPHYVYDVEGTDIDVARFVDGDPECWARQEQRLTEGPGRRVFRFVFAWVVSGGVSTRTIESRGAAAVALIQAMELAGHGVEVDLCYSVGAGANCGSGASYRKVEAYVNIKKADQPLDLPRLAFAIAHPASLRRIGFGLMERLPRPILYNFTKSKGYGNGDGLFDPLEQGDVFLGGATYDRGDWNNDAWVQKWIVDTLKAQGIELARVGQE